MGTSTEGVRYLEKYIFDNEITYPSNGSFDYSFLNHVFDSIQILDRPDFYSIVGNTIYIIEHFEIDSTKHNRKGSKQKIEEFKDELRFQQVAGANNDNMSIYNGQINAEPKIEFYKENLFAAFDDHYNKIESYKNHVRELVQDFDKYKVVTIFIIEDSSIFGSLYFKNGLKLLLPVFAREFNSYFKSKQNLDLVLCSSETNTNTKISWILARCDIEHMLDKEVSLNDIELVDLRPMSLRASIFIPKK